jgi:hypothetical protein
MVKISISEAVLKYFKIFKEGGTEDVVNLIQRHESIISDKKLHAKYSTYASLMSDKKDEFDKLKLKSKKLLKTKRNLLLSKQQSRSTVCKPMLFKKKLSILSRNFWTRLSCPCDVTSW